jgi:Tol biopolymer transport system component
MTMRAEIWWRPPMGRRWLLCVAAALAAAGAARAAEFGDWSAPTNAASLPGSSSSVNTAVNDGCPILNPYDNSLYMASARTGGAGGLDIWIAPWTGDGWGEPVNAGPAINTSADEFCPAPSRGNRLLFVRRNGTNTDIFVSKRLPNQGFGAAQRLPTGSDAINSPAEEWSPSLFETDDGREVLYFSSTREGRQRIYYSVNFGPAQLASGGVNTSSEVNDARPNVRHDGLEIVWDSNRFGTLGGQDIWTATRSSVDEPWGSAVHLENGINSTANDTRASLSWDGTRLVFGSGRSGGGDIYTATREKD